MYIGGVAGVKLSPTGSTYEKHDNDGMIRVWWEYHEKFRKVERGSQSLYTFGRRVCNVDVSTDSPV